MLVEDLEHMNLEDTTYFVLYAWDDCDAAKIYPFAYFRKKCADKRMNKLIEAGYKTVIMRKEEVFLRTPDTEISVSSAVNIWNKNEVTDE